MKKTFAATLLIGAASLSQVANAQVFGGADDVAFASNLWKSLVAAKLAGPDAIQSHTYKGQHPHGAVLQTLYSAVAVGGNTGEVIVKRNYGGKGVTPATVIADPTKNLGAVTVMFKRPGYDPDNKDWFWAKFKPDGSLDKNPKGIQLAGRVAKGASKGCIACHSAAPGGDMEFLR